MKWMVFIIFLLIVNPKSAVAKSETIFYDSFEDWPANQPSEWIILDNNLEILQSDNLRRTGNYSAQFNPINNVTKTLSIETEHFLGDQRQIYNVSAWVFDNLSTASVTLSMYFYDDDNRYLGFIESKASNDVNQWQFLSFAYQSPVDTLFIKIQINYIVDSESPISFIDDVKLEIISGEIDILQSVSPFLYLFGFVFAIFLALVSAKRKK